MASKIINCRGTLAWVAALAVVYGARVARAEGTCKGCNPQFPFDGTRNNNACRDSDLVGTDNNCCGSTMCAAGYYAKLGGSNCGIMGGTSFECYSGECGCAASDGTCMDHSLQCKYDPTKEFCSNSAIPSTPKGYCPSSASYCKGDSGVYFENSCQCKSDPSIKICSDKACRYTSSSLCPDFTSTTDDDDDGNAPTAGSKTSPTAPTVITAPPRTSPPLIVPSNIESCASLGVDGGSDCTELCKSKSVGGVRCGSSSYSSASYGSRRVNSFTTQEVCICRPCNAMLCGFVAPSTPPPPPNTSPTPPPPTDAKGQPCATHAGTTFKRMDSTLTPSQCNAPDTCEFKCSRSYVVAQALQSGVCMVTATPATTPDGCDCDTMAAELNDAAEIKTDTMFLSWKGTPFTSNIRVKATVGGGLTCYGDYDGGFPSDRSSSKGGGGGGGGAGMIVGVIVGVLVLWACVGVGVYMARSSASGARHAGNRRDVRSGQAAPNDFANPLANDSSSA